MRNHAITYRAKLDVPRELAQSVGPYSRPSATRTRFRALICFWQAVLVCGGSAIALIPTALARDHHIFPATAHRYPDEVITVLAERALDLHHALEDTTEP